MRFIELTDIRTGEKVIINTGHITLITPSKIHGCEIVLNYDEGRPICVVETYEELKEMLIVRL